MRWPGGEAFPLGQAGGLLIRFAMAGGVAIAFPLGQAGGLLSWVAIAFPLSSSPEACSTGLRWPGVLGGFTLVQAGGPAHLVNRAALGARKASNPVLRPRSGSDSSKIRLITNVKIKIVIHYPIRDSPLSSLLPSHFPSKIFGHIKNVL